VAQSLRRASKFTDADQFASSPLEALGCWKPQAVVDPDPGPGLGSGHHSPALHQVVRAGGSGMLRPRYQQENPAQARFQGRARGGVNVRESILEAAPAEPGA
jgi:hypothetical protein